MLLVNVVNCPPAPTNNVIFVGTILAIKHEKEKKCYGQSKSNKFLDTLPLKVSPAQLKQSILVNLEQQ
jgi:hypothetical protein